MTTNTTQVTPKIPAATINYFDQSFAKEGLKYVKRDLDRQIERAKCDCSYYEQQASQMNNLAKRELDRIEGLRYELEAVNAAMKQKTDEHRL
jgi:hypothetical protein